MFRFRFSARQSNAKRTRRIRIGTLPARAAASAGSSPPYRRSASERSVPASKLYIENKQYMFSQIVKNT